MANPISWHGCNTVLTPHHTHSDQIAPLAAFNNGKVTVTCWELSQDEILQIIKDRCIFVGVLMGVTSPPLVVGTEEALRQKLVDHGKVWKRNE